ncbi:protein eyes shut homolog [Petromyzon marinus]|uniref:protein eyes shut homolog n=1 Tax=Petromyzon marinus TaxID=7757 RepID=UPI003F6F271F
MQILHYIFGIAKTSQLNMLLTLSTQMCLHSGLPFLLTVALWHSFAKAQSGCQDKDVKQWHKEPQNITVIWTTSGRLCSHVNPKCQNENESDSTENAPLLHPEISQMCALDMQLGDNLYLIAPNGTTMNPAYVSTSEFSCPFNGSSGEPRRRWALFGGPVSGIRRLDPNLLAEGTHRFAHAAEGSLEAGARLAVRVRRHECGPVEGNAALCSGRGACEAPASANAFRCRCREPYAGPHCEAAAGACSPNPCGNGAICVPRTEGGAGSGYRCKCAEGFVGWNCSEAVGACNEQRCEHGSCVDVTPSTFVCECHAGYMGPTCSAPIDRCASLPCTNGGTCIEVPGSFVCICPKGLMGRRCELDINECASDPCGPLSLCINSVGGYRCFCAPGFIGARCDSDADECLSSPCWNGASCSNLRNGFSCECLPGFQGGLCEQEVNECSSSPCHHDGSCIDLVDGYICLCPPGLTGPHCEMDIDECGSSPCLHGATCLDLIGGYYCQCLAPFKGPDCELVPCEGFSPCENAAVCRQEVDLAVYPMGSSCSCPAGFAGLYCETNTDDCASAPCNHGFCYDALDSFYCLCSPGYAGELCELNIDDCEVHRCQNNATCEDRHLSYVCLCEPGWTGEFCERDADDCENNPCHNNGVCLDLFNDYRCECADGWAGQDCTEDIDECASRPCLNGGTCSDPGAPGQFSCRCRPFYAGSHCQDPRDPCGSSHNPCHKNARCLTLSDGTAHCECPPGFDGDLCESDKNECLSEPCKNNGVCKDRTNGFECLCFDGFLGTFCEVNINECESMPCENNATCIDLHNRFRCHCPAGYYGPLCELDVNECELRPCENGGACINLEGSYRCLCIPGFTGALCDENVDECASTPCLHQSACANRPGGGGYSCQCLPGYTGARCGIHADVCASEPCRNGRCIDALGHFTCVCEPGWTGVQCDADINECDLNPCQHGGSCLDSSTAFRCSCAPPGYTGTACQTDVCAEGSELHSPAHCEHGDICQEGPATNYTCRCLPGYVGTHCELETHECESSPCENGATCRDLVNGFTCVCAIGFSGDRCEVDADECLTNPCVNGVCQEGKNELGYLCYCLPGYLGLNCEFNYDDCLIEICPEGYLCKDGLNNITCVSEPSSLMPDIKPNFASHIDPQSVFPIMEQSSGPIEKSLLNVLFTLQPSISMARALKQTNSGSTDMLMTSPSELFPFQFNDLDSTTPTTQSVISTEVTSDQTPSKTTQHLDNMRRNFISPFNKCTTTAVFDEEFPGSHSWPGANSGMHITRPLPFTEEPKTLPAVASLEKPMTDRRASSQFPSTGAVSSAADPPSSPGWAATRAVKPSAVTLSYRQRDGTVASQEQAGHSSSPTEPVLPSFQISAQLRSDIERDRYVWLRPSLQAASTEMFLPGDASVLPERISARAAASMTKTPPPPTPPPPPPPPPHLVPMSPCQRHVCLNGGTCRDVLLPGEMVMSFRCDCPLHFTGHFCQLDDTIYFPSFGGSSFLKLPALSLLLENNNERNDFSPRKDLSFEIVITVMTAAVNGTILYSGSEGLHAFFIHLFLTDGRPTARLGCGRFDTIVTVSSPQRANHGQLSTITARVSTPGLSGSSSACALELSVDGIAVYQTREVRSLVHPKDAFGPTLIGGLEEQATAGGANGLVGCVRELQVNGRELSIVGEATRGCNVENCNVPVCERRPCGHGGTCVSDAENWFCECTPGRHGKLCQFEACVVNPCGHGATCVRRGRGGEGGAACPVCLCPFGRTGPLCDDPIHVTVPSFDGTDEFGFTSFLAYPAVLGLNDAFEFLVKLTLANNSSALRDNLIFFAGQKGKGLDGDDFLALGLQGGRVVYRYNLGSGTASLLSDPVDTRLHMHTIRLGRTLARGWLQVDGQRNVSGASPGQLSGLNVFSQLYVGGVNEFAPALLPDGARFLQSFQGCVLGIWVRAGPGDAPSVRLSHPVAGRSVGQCLSNPCALLSCHNGGTCVPLGASVYCRCARGWRGGECAERTCPCGADHRPAHRCAAGATCVPLHPHGYTCRCALGQAGAYCGRALQISDPSFSTNQSSWMEFEPFSVRHHTHIRIQFMPRSGEGILFYTAQHLAARSGDFLSISLSGGFVQLRFNLGDGTICLASTRPTDPGMETWYTLEAGRVGNSGYLSLNGKNVTTRERLGMRALDAKTSFFVGGVFPLSAISSSATEDGPSAFDGCVREVVVNGRRLTLTANGAKGGANVADCDGTACGHEVCRNHGQCRPKGGVDFECVCGEHFTGAACETPVACVHRPCKNGAACLPANTEDLNLLGYVCACRLQFQGQHCENKITFQTAGFSGDGYIKHTDVRYDRRNLLINEISFNFTTESKDGLLLWLGLAKDGYDDYLAVGLERSHLKVAVNLGKGISAPVVITVTHLCKNEWHSVIVRRKQTLMWVYLDGDLVVAEDLDPHRRYKALNYDAVCYLGGFELGRDVSRVTFNLYSQRLYGKMRDVRLHPDEEAIDFALFAEGYNVHGADEL